MNARRVIAPRSRRTRGARFSLTAILVIGLIATGSPAGAATWSAAVTGRPQDAIAASTLARAAAGDPIGFLDRATETADGRIEVTGWAADPRAPQSREEVHIYVIGPTGVRLRITGHDTGQVRDDVAAVYPWAGRFTGYHAFVPNAGPGANQVCTYAINVNPPQTNPWLGCVMVNVQVEPPIGYVDSVTVTGHTAVVKGWSFDPNHSTSSIPVHIYVNNDSHTISERTIASTNGTRQDVNAAYGISGRHGFSRTVRLGEGSNWVCAYGIGDNGNNAMIGWCFIVRPGADPDPTDNDKPNASNTGVPAGWALDDYSGPLTITADGTVIENKVIYGDLKIQAANVTIRNSYLHCGSGTPDSNSGCIDANSSDVENLLIENTTINPDHPSYYRDGIVGHEFTARDNHITRTNDGIGIFNRPGGSAQANVTVEGNYIHDLTHWNNDPAHSDGTHNDGIQIQGGENISIRGNNVVGSVVAGDGLGDKGRHGGAALLAQQNVAPLANAVIEDNWFDDAQNSVCVQNGSYPSVSLTLRNNAFGRNQYVYGDNSTYQIRIYSRSASHVAGLATNRWDDTNGLLTEGKDGGIRYNGP